MFKKIQLLLILCISLYTVSCKQDEGNYDYKDINEIKISGLKEKYSVMSLDNFNIVPQVTNSLESKNSASLSYKWQALHTTSSIGFGDEKNKLIDLSTEKDLTVPIQL
ncbi:MAG: PKD-like family lipoprotein, partial [Polaribacter sp.]